jgi:hypothetical protein
VRLQPGPDGPSRVRARLLNLALVGGLVVVWLAARSRRLEISDLERQSVGPTDLESLDTPPEFDPYQARGAGQPEAEG